MAKLIWVDDHVRHTMGQALKLYEDIEVVAEVSDGRTAVALVRDMHPDVGCNPSATFVQVSAHDEAA